MPCRRFGTTYRFYLKMARNPSKCKVGFVDFWRWTGYVLSRSFGKTMPPYAVHYPTGAQILSTSRRKPEIKCLFVRQNLSSSSL
jgi:hypothetical protein